MQTANERLKRIRELRGFSSAREAARAYGWKVDTYASHENGNRGIPPDAAIRYSKALRFSLDWLYNGTETIKTIGLNAKPGLAFKVVPRLSWDFMTTHGGLNKAMEEAAEYTSLPQNLPVTMPAFSMTMRDDSMKDITGRSPSFEAGEDLIFSTKEKPRPGDFVLVEILDDNTVTFRQYRERGLNTAGFMTFELAPLNPAYPTRLVTSATQARIVAKMTHSIKSY